MAQRLDGFQGQSAAAGYNHPARSVQASDNRLVVRDGAQRGHTCQVCAWTSEAAGCSAIGKQQSRICNLLTTLQLDDMLSYLDAYYAV